MRRAYIVYILMVLALAGGLAIVLTLGDSLRAPDDLSGVWNVEWDHRPPHALTQKSVMHIDQSGRFFTGRFEDGPTWRLKLEDNWRGASDGPTLAMSFEGDVYYMNCTGSIPPTEPRRANSLKLEVIGKLIHTGYASRKPQTIAKGTDPSAPLAPAKTADAR